MRLLALVLLSACSPEIAVSVGPGNDGVFTVSWNATQDSQLVVAQPATGLSEVFVLPAGCGLVHTNLGNFDGYALAVLTSDEACAQATTDLGEPLALPAAECEPYDGLAYVGC